MESLAYLEIALARDESEVTPLNSVKALNKRTFFKLSRELQCSFLFLVVLLSGLTTTDEALAQRLLKLGVSGSDVTAVQRRLQELGLFNQPLTEYYGPATESAVIRFQRARNLTPDGQVGSDTRRALFNTQSTVNTQSTRILQPPILLDPPLPPPRREIVISASTATPVLREGDEGADVRRLQQALANQGFSPGQIDGDYGPNTVRAVRAFQSSRGLGVDGVAGVETLRALGLTSQPAQRDRNNLPYVVVIPDTDSTGTLLTRVRAIFAGAFPADSRRGRYINAGSFAEYEAAASRSYALRARGFDARVVHF